MTEREAYKVLAKASGIKKGDKVKVLRKPKGPEIAWGPLWNQEAGMDETINQIGTVEYITDDCHIRVGFGSPDMSSWSLPWFVLEIVEKAPRKITVKIDDEPVELSELSAKNLHKALGDELEK